MNPPPPSGNLHRSLPVLAALTLAALSWVFLGLQKSGHQASAERHILCPPAGLPPELPEAPRHPSLPGVLSLPPATLASAPKTAAAVTHPLPPDSRAVFTLADLKAQIPQREDGTFVMEIPSLHFSAADPAARNTMDGQRVETVAQLSPWDTGHRLSRKLTRCCTADAREFSIAAALPPASTPVPAGTWVKATGRIRYRRELGGLTAVLEIDSIAMVRAPEHPVLH